MARKLTGKVVSDKMQNTVIVAVETLKTHPIYRKRYKTTARFQAHDATNKLTVGTLVEIEETRPMSRMKRFVVTKIIDGEVKKASSKESVK